MNINDYCKGLEQELTVWKARLFDLQHKLDKLPSADKQRVLSNVEDLRMLVVDLDDRTERLRTECPTEWGAERGEIDNAYKVIGVKYEDAIDVIGAGNFGG
ncbi:MAG: hypothetical protein SWH54_07530 [Thermodesulfobacteriota bacterium]|nr:hypothetical protein [Thermodesulfobacteriota bacterium]